MPKELPPQYQPNEIEDRIYRLWEESGFFNPDKLPKTHKKPFTVIMPPPNANGSLHIGHAVFVTLQDIMVRFSRMRGRRALWVPGADHAGFETQVVFDRKLEKEGRSRFKIPRDDLYAEMIAFTQENKRIMENQLRKLGASCDWSREKFTLDPDIVDQAQKTFVDLYDDGLIYRGERIVNWCRKHQTALADLETKHVEQADSLYYLRYGPFVLATARPETKFGDKYVVMHPKDARYNKYYDGQNIEVEWINGPITATIIKDEVIDMNFGTGAMTITPWHDAVDFELAERRGLAKEQVIDRYGKLLPVAETFAGMRTDEARSLIVARLKEKGLLVKIEENYAHTVAVCYKCATSIEPQVLPQWFLKMKPLAKQAIEAVRKKQIVFVPARFKKVYLHWLTNIRDWNLSQQITWGIRIPAWFCISCGAVRVNETIKGNWYFVRHGETDWNVGKRVQGHTDIGLNDTGKAQVREAGKQLKSRNIDLIISSDLRRARETAEAIVQETGAELILDSAFRERSYGSVEGLTGEEIREQGYGHIFEDPLSAAPEGETIQQVEDRVLQALARHKTSHRHKNIVIVSHGSTLSTLLGNLRNITHAERKNMSLHNASITHLSVASACASCGSDFVEQDPDVLTTWFSSGQWPYLALGYPKHKDFKTFYPTDVMETGWDILFFWVARMVMLGLYRTKKIPFKTVYLHGLVRDKDRQKMSKSKGNVIDPLGVAETYGTDAVRMALVIGNLPGNDIIISEEKIKGYRNFANKIWNATRFLLMHADTPAQMKKVAFGKKEKALLARLDKVTKDTTRDMEAMRFHHAAERLYHFFWHYYADVVIEQMKENLAMPDGSKEKETAKALLLRFHGTMMILLHPFMPFITEEVWAKLPTRGKKGQNLLMIEQWPIR